MIMQGQFCPCCITLSVILDTVGGRQGEGGGGGLHVEKK